jgi:uncharacterized membrane protein YgcG
MKFIIYIIICISLIISLTPMVRAADSVTDTIRVEVDQSAGKTVARYTVVQAFNVDTKHGIFLALPLTPNGVKIDYKVLSVTKGDKPEPYQMLNDMFNYRFRIGDPNVKLATGVYVYNMVVEAKYDSNNQFSYPVLTDWNDTITNLEVKVNGTTQVSNGNSGLYSILTNVGKPELPLITQLYNRFALPLIILITGLFTAFAGHRSTKIHHLSSEYPYSVPEFQPPKDLLPWQGSYLINDGAVGLEETLIAYYLYLNNLGYITLGTDSSSEKINFTINKELPNILPSSFNDIITQSKDNNLTDVFESLQISEDYSQELNKYITKDIKPYYDRLPNSDAFGTVFVIYLVVYMIGLFVWFLLIEPIFLFAPIWLWFILGIGLFFIPWLHKVFSTQERFSANGLEMFRMTKGFYNYINVAEKDKLDFDNNPTEGAKYYLANVPWAAQLGLLKQFNTLAANLNIPQPTINSIDGVSASVFASSFYVDPSSSSSSSGGGGGFSGGGGSW